MIPGVWKCRHDFDQHFKPQYCFYLILIWSAVFELQPQIVWKTWYSFKGPNTLTDDRTKLGKISFIIKKLVFWWSEGGGKWSRSELPFGRNWKLLIFNPYLVKSQQAVDPSRSYFFYKLPTGYQLSCFFWKLRLLICLP